MPKLSASYLAIVTVPLLANCGCGNSELARVKGVVTLEGSPVNGAVVTFQSEDGGSLFTGTTDADGAYELSPAKSNDQKGAKVGTHRIMIAAVEFQGAAESSELGSLGMMAHAEPKVKSLLPEKYSDFATSGLTFEVNKGGNSANFELEN